MLKLHLKPAKTSVLKPLKGFVNVSSIVQQTFIAIWGKSSRDTRYAIDSVVTHCGVKFLCWALSDLLSFQQTLEEMLMTRHNDGEKMDSFLWRTCCSLRRHFRTSFQYLLKKHGGKQAAWEYPFVVAWE
ncbi:hypothetical protein ACFX19_030828 [Malus domestica]